MTSIEVLGIVPARGGSKSISSKNVAPLAGRPLLAYTADSVRGSRTLSRTIVTTDDPEIARVARSLEFEVPFLRPMELAQDETPMLPVLLHALDWYARETGTDPEAVVLLQPTSPFRQAAHIDACVDLLLKNGADSVVSVVAVPHRYMPGSLVREAGGWLAPYQAAAVDPGRRQAKGRLFARNGPAVLAAKSATIRRGELYGPRTLAYLMDERDSLDVDEPYDLEVAEALISTRASKGVSL